MQMFSLRLQYLLTCKQKSVKFTSLFYPKYSEVDLINVNLDQPAPSSRLLRVNTVCNSPVSFIGQAQILGQYGKN